jgi:hypothetical protein
LGKDDPVPESMDQKAGRQDSGQDRKDQVNGHRFLEIEFFDGSVKVIHFRNLPISC